MRRFGWMLGLGERWRPGEKLKLLFAGYNGTRNTGSDVRVQEMLRQIRHVLGAEHVDFSVMTQDFERTKGYFERTRQVTFLTCTRLFSFARCNRIMASSLAKARCSKASLPTP